MPKDFQLQITENCAKQMIEMGIQLYMEKQADPKQIAECVIEVTKEMVARGNIKNGIICGKDEL